MEMTRLPQNRPVRGKDGEMTKFPQNRSERDKDGEKTKILGDHLKVDREEKMTKCPQGHLEGGKEEETKSESGGVVDTLRERGNVIKVGHRETETETESKDLMASSNHLVAILPIGKHQREKERAGKVTEEHNKTLEAQNMVRNMIDTLADRGIDTPLRSRDDIPLGVPRESRKGVQISLLHNPDPSKGQEASTQVMVQKKYQVTVGTMLQKRQEVRLVDMLSGWNPRQTLANEPLGMVK